MSHAARRGGRVAAAEYVALGSFRHALRHFLHFSEQAARRAGLSAQQHQALLVVKALSSNEEITIGSLARALILQHHSTVGMVDRLTKKRLLKRTPSNQDRRKVFITLTAQGEKVIEALSAAHRHELRRIGPELRRWLETLDESEEK